MKLDRQTVARVSAQWNSWSPEEFASCAEKRNIYQPGSGACFFAIERGDKEAPWDELTKPDCAAGLTMVMPYKAVSKRMLLALQAIEKERLPIVEDRTRNLMIEVVGDVGREALTGDIKYSLIAYNSVMALTWEINKQGPDSLNKESIKHLRGVLEMKLKGHPWQEALSEIE